MANDKAVRVSEETLSRLKKRLTQWQAKTGNPNLSLGELVKKLLDKTDDKK